MKPQAILTSFAFWAQRIGPFFSVLAFHWPYIDFQPPYSTREYLLFTLLFSTLAAIPVGFQRTDWLARFLGFCTMTAACLLMLKPMPNLAAQLPMSYLYPAVAGLLLLAYGNRRT